MNDNYDFYDNDKKWAYKLCYGCFIGIVICVLIALLSGCKSIQYVPVTEHEIHHDSIYLTTVQIDSIYIKDSTFQKEYSRNASLCLHNIIARCCRQ